MGLYGVKDGLPYDQWPDSALRQLQEDLGRNGFVEAQERISDEVAAVLKKREETGLQHPEGGPVVSKV